jgi:hypothetical protein
MPTPTIAAIGAATCEPARAPAEARRFDRARRVTLLVVTTALLGLFDLMHTLSYMGGAGMMELNPVARAMIDLGGARQLILFKMFTIATSCGILYILRRYRQAEICAWISLAALAMLAAHWINYNGHVVEVAAFADATAFASDPRWVALD